MSSWVQIFTLYNPFGKPELEQSESLVGMLGLFRLCLNAICIVWDGLHPHGSPITPTTQTNKQTKPVWFIISLLIYTKTFHEKSKNLKVYWDDPNSIRLLKKVGFLFTWGFSRLPLVLIYKKDISEGEQTKPQTEQNKLNYPTNNEQRTLLLLWTIAVYSIFMIFLVLFWL